MPERDAEFNQMSTERLFAIWILDFKRRVWDELTEEQQIARGQKAREEMRLRREEGRD